MNHGEQDEAVLVKWMQVSKLKDSHFRHTSIAFLEPSISWLQNEDCTVEFLRWKIFAKPRNAMGWQCNTLLDHSFQSSLHHKLQPQKSADTAFQQTMPFHIMTKKNLQTSNTKSQHRFTHSPTIKQLQKLAFNWNPRNEWTRFRYPLLI